MRTPLLLVTSLTFACVAPDPKDKGKKGTPDEDVEVDEVAMADSKTPAPAPAAAPTPAPAPKAAPPKPPTPTPAAGGAVEPASGAFRASVLGSWKWLEIADGPEADWQPAAGNQIYNYKPDGTVETAPAAGPPLKWSVFKDGDRHRIVLCRDMDKECNDDNAVSNGKMFIEVDGTNMIQHRANAAGVVNARAKFVKQAGK